MNYEEIFRPEAERTVKPLADEVATLSRQLATLRRRCLDEQESVRRAEEDIAALKQIAAARLEGDTGGYDRFKTSLKKLQAKLDTAQEIVRTFEELIPAKERDLASAKNKLQSTFLALAAAARPACEARMAELIGTVLAERDAFVATFERLALDYGADFTGANKLYPDGLHYRPDPHRADFLIATGLEESLIEAGTVRARRGPYLSPPSPQPAQVTTQEPSEPVGVDPGATGEAAPDNSDAPAAPLTQEPIPEPPLSAVGASLGANGRAAEPTQDGQAEAETAEDAEQGPEVVPVDSPRADGIAGESC